jgi:hypothetical protein
MQGIYKITNGNKISTYKNIITTNGRVALLTAISGQKQGWAESIVAGISDTAATANDTALGYLVTGGDINTTIIDPVNEKLYFKTSLPLQDELTIYELGCYASSTLSTQSSESGGGGILVLFTTDIEWVDTAGSSVADTTNNRVGKDSISYTIAASATVSGYLSYISDMTFIPTNGSFKLAYNSTGLADFVLRFKVDDSNYYEYNGYSVTNGYHIVSVLKSDFVATGTPLWSDIQVVEIEATAGGSGGSISIDALSYELPLTDVSNLLSRVVLTTPQQKLPGVPLDIEYLLEI